MTAMRTGSKFVLVSLAGVVVGVGALGGVVHGIRAGVAQAWYCRAKYGEPPADVDQSLALCQKAFRLYPHNYYFSILAAERAYATAQSASDAAATAWLRAAQLWCDRGLAQNVWRSQLRRLKTRFLWEESPAEAIAYWRRYTDWQFWEPYNHAVLAEMYARTGDLERATECLYWARGDPHGTEVRVLIRKAQEKQDAAAALEGLE
jgi:hypothetical protein